MSLRCWTVPLNLTTPQRNNFCYRGINKVHKCSSQILSRDRGPDLDQDQDEVQCQDWDQGPGLGSNTGSRVGVRTQSGTWVRTLFMAGFKTGSRHSKSSKPGCVVSISQLIKGPDSFQVCSVKGRGTTSSVSGSQLEVSCHRTQEPLDTTRPEEMFSQPSMEI